MGDFTHSGNVIRSLLIALYCIHGVLATVSPYLNPGFDFDYDNSNQPLSIPVTRQCERIQLTWTRDANSTGFSPVAPYFLQVYSSASSVPYFVEAGFGPTFDWDVPFPPNTQYQICMFDINGVSGGCQQIYSVIANTTVNNPTCQNVTAPSALSVSATVPTGAMSQYSYIDQCTSLSVTPTSGSPPFTLTIAPDFHPPYNITSNSMNPIFWQVALPVGFHFFISLESADGLMWANGPMRVGGLGPNNCLVPGTVSKSFFQNVIIGSSIGSAFFGIAAGILGYIFFLKEWRRRRRSPSQSYLASEYASRNNASKPLRAASSAASSIALTSPTWSSLPISSMPAMPLPSTPPSRSSDLPLEPVRRPGSSVRRNRSIDPFNVTPSETESISSHTPSQSSRTQSRSSHYPLDVKQPLPTSPDAAASTFSRDDTSSLTSSSTHRTPRRQRPLSIQSRAPTYVTVSQPSNLRGTVIAINETDDEQREPDEHVPDLPPQYGRHTADPSLNYAPSVLSSGNRF